MRHSALPSALILGLAWALGACGTKGPLVLPPKQAPTTQPAPATGSAPADDSKAGSGAAR